MCQLIQSIACFSLYDYGQYIRIALYKMQPIAGMGVYLGVLNEEPGVYIAIWV